MAQMKKKKSNINISLISWREPGISALPLLFLSSFGPWFSAPAALSPAASLLRRASAGLEEDGGAGDGPARRRPPGVALLGVASARARRRRLPARALVGVVAARRVQAQRERRLRRPGAPPLLLLLLGRTALRLRGLLGLRGRLLARALARVLAVPGADLLLARRRRLLVALLLRLLVLVLLVLLGRVLLGLLRHGGGPQPPRAPALHRGQDALHLLHGVGRLVRHLARRLLAAVAQAEGLRGLQFDAALLDLVDEVVHPAARFGARVWAVCLLLVLLGDPDHGGQRRYGVHRRRWRGRRRGRAAA